MKKKINICYMYAKMFVFMQSAICIKRFWSMQSATVYMN